MDALQVDDITVSFGSLTALDRVSMSVEKREVVGVIGPNGAGKTTLFNVICGFVRPAQGRLSVDGTTLRSHQPHELARRGIARTLQGVGLWSGLDVVENVMVGRTSQAKAGLMSSLLALRRSGRDEASMRAKAMSCLEELRIADYADRAPLTLPYAIQKRVALARALVSEPSLLLLDEPASGLSEAEMDDLGLLIRDLRERMSVLIVEHHMDLVMSICDRLVVLDFGRVIATGVPAQIQSDPAVTRAYLGVDASELEASFSGPAGADAADGADGHPAAGIDLGASGA